MRPEAVAVVTPAAVVPLDTGVAPVPAPLATTSHMYPLAGAVIDAVHERSAVVVDVGVAVSAVAATHDAVVVMDTGPAHVLESVALHAALTYIS